MKIYRYRQPVAGKILLILGFMFPYFFLAGQSFGNGAPDTNVPPVTAWSRYLQGGYVHRFKRNMDNANGSFWVDRIFVQSETRYAPEHSRSYSLVFGYSYDDYDFSGKNGFAALQPWDGIHSFRLSAPIRHTRGQNWSFFIVPTISVTGESGVNISDSLTGGGFAGFSYRFNERLSIGPGMGIITQIEADPSIFPVLIFNWKITDTLSLTTGQGPGSTAGPGISLNWKYSEQLLVTLGGGYEKLRFRLDDDAEESNGIGQDKSFPLVGGITYNFNSSARMILTGGVEAAGELQLEDHKGDRVEQQDYKRALFLGFNLYCRF